MSCLRSLGVLQAKDAYEKAYRETRRVYLAAVAAAKDPADIGRADFEMTRALAAIELAYRVRVEGGLSVDVEQIPQTLDNALKYLE